MTKIHYITYATHEQGTFKDFINNKYGVSIKVLGFGEKWQGFLGKARSILKYIRTLPDDEIVVVLDGFDTIVNGSPKNILNIFESYRTRILVSQDPILGSVYIVKKIFGECNNVVANAGMYMGYVADVEKMLESVLTEKSEDDQRGMNMYCSSVNDESVIKVDKSFKIFQNISLINAASTNSDAIFISYPGCGKCSKYELFERFVIRGVPEYIGFFKIEIAVIVLLLLYFYVIPMVRRKLNIFKKKK